MLGSWNGSGPMLWVDHLGGDYQLTLGISGLSDYLDSGQTPTAGQWQYLSATYDGSTARYYIDGTQVASRSVSCSVGSSNVWRIGAYGSPAGGFFDGLIDNVRIYNRALSAAEVQTDMNLPVGRRAAPAGLAAPGGADGQRPDANLAVAAVDCVSRRHRLRRLPGRSSLVDTTSATTFTFSGSVCGTTRISSASKPSTRPGTRRRATTLTASTALCGAPTGLVAAYSFDDGAGSVLERQLRATATTAPSRARAGPSGHDGGALSFDGTQRLGRPRRARHLLPERLHARGLGQEEQAPRRTSAVLGSWNGSGPMLWVDHLGGDYQLTMASAACPTTSTPGRRRRPGSGSTWRRPTTAARPATTSTAPRSPAAASATRSAAPTSGGSAAYGSPAGGFFDGLIDNVRIYNRALSAAEVQTDMNLPVPASGRRHDAADGARQALRPTATQRERRPELERGDRQPRGRPLQRLPRDELGLHAHSSQPDRDSRAGRASPIPDLAPGTYYYKVTAAGRRRQRRADLEPGQRDLVDTTPARRPGDADGDRRGRAGST